MAEKGLSPESLALLDLVAPAPLYNRPKEWDRHEDVEARLQAIEARVHPDANNPERNHYAWFMPENPTAAVDEYLDDFEAKMREALTDPFVHDMAHSVLPLIAAYREARAALHSWREARSK